VELRPAGRAVQGLPVYLAHTYEFLEGRLLGQELLFALQRERADDQTPTRLKADYGALLKAAPGAFMVLVLDELPSYLRRRLIEAGIPFVVPGKQIFLSSMLDLREQRRTYDPQEIEHLGWAAQVVLLRHLLHGDVENQNLAGVASLVGYSAMVISSGQRQLVNVDLAWLRREGRSKQLVFAGLGRELWERALPRLRRPWRKRYPVTVASTRPQTWVAGTDALARGSLLTEGKIPTVAMAAAEFRRAIDEATLVKSPAADEADWLVESWQYNPARLATGDVVDPLSLYLCLRDDPDERVQIALGQHMKALSW